MDEKFKLIILFLAGVFTSFFVPFLLFLMWQLGVF
jgi:hypothetical protein